MLCERCKIREANIQYTEIVNGVKTEHHFCAQCAKELDFGPYSAIFDSDFPLGKLLSGLLGVGETAGEEQVQVVCPTCGLSYEEFVKNSRFGCPDCYGVFDLLISDKIKQLQGNDSHKGKQPEDWKRKQKEMAAGSVFGSQKEAQADSQAKAGETGAEGNLESETVPAGSGRSIPEIEEEIRVLDARRQEAIRREEYETAAQCRDRIKELREEIGL